MKKTRLKVLVGGVPFGRNNIGDEAILEGMVALLRRLDSSLIITVSTDDPATAERLQVKVCPLFGFSHVQFSEIEARNTISRHSLYIWCGATGLSDYPEEALKLLDVCHELDVPSLIFGTGMNKKLNPAKYSINSGKKLSILKALRLMSLGAINTVKLYEEFLQYKTRRHLKKSLKHPELVVLRDRDSAFKLSNICNRNEIKVGADPAIIIQPDNQNWFDFKTRTMLKSKRQKIGICISAQRGVQNIEGLATAIDQWITTYSTEIFFIPMNPVTDHKLMSEIYYLVKNKDFCHVVNNCNQPGQVVSLSSHMDLIISSRLHLLILASISKVPLIGISRGSKVDSFLKNFGLRPAGSVEILDLQLLNKQVGFFLNNKPKFLSVAGTVRKEMLKRLDEASKLLRATIAKIAGEVQNA